MAGSPPVTKRKSEADGRLTSHPQKKNKQKDLSEMTLTTCSMEWPKSMAILAAGLKTLMSTGKVSIWPSWVTCKVLRQRRPKS